MNDRAIFLDRDGTIIEDPGYLSDPSKIRLLPGVDLALKAFRNNGYRLVIITNQSAVARGIIDEEQLEEIHDQLRLMLREKGVEIDGLYYCPDHPDGVVEQYSQESDMRKPAPGMILLAAKELGLSLASSWMIGDSERDVQAGISAGCKTVRITDPARMDLSNDDWQGTEAVLVASNLVDASRQIIRTDISCENRPGQLDEIEIVFDDAEEEEEDDMEYHGAEVNARGTTGQEGDSEHNDAGQLEVAGDTSEDEYEDEDDDEYEYEEEEDEEEDEGEYEDDEDEDEDEDDVLPVDEGIVAVEPPPIVKTERSVPGPGTSDSGDSYVRKEILKHVRQLNTSSHHDEFSLFSVLSGLSQTLVAMFLIMSLYEAFGPENLPWATLWAVLAMTFQIMCLTFVIMVRKRL